MLPSQSVDKEGLVAQKRRRLDYPVAHIMEEPVATCNVNDPVSSVIDEMKRKAVAYTVATFWDEVQGIITYRDIIKLVAEESSTIDVPTYIVGLPEDPFDSEVATDKFQRTVEMLRRSYPDIMEARSIIKGGRVGGGKRQYAGAVRPGVAPYLPVDFDPFLHAKLRKSSHQCVPHALEPETRQASVVFDHGNGGWAFTGDLLGHSAE